MAAVADVSGARGGEGRSLTINQAEHWITGDESAMIGTASAWGIASVHALSCPKAKVRRSLPLSSPPRSTTSPLTTPPRHDEYCPLLARYRIVCCDTLLVVLVLPFLSFSKMGKYSREPTDSTKSAHLTLARALTSSDIGLHSVLGADRMFAIVVSVSCRAVKARGSNLRVHFKVRLNTTLPGAGVGRAVAIALETAASQALDTMPCSFQRLSCCMPPVRVSSSPLASL
jgi:hypothetical protein